MNKQKLSRYLLLMQEAKESDFGIKVKTNNAAELQQQLGAARVKLRQQGITDFDLLSFRQLKLEDHECEYVYITKRLSPEEIIKLTQGDSDA